MHLLRILTACIVAGWLAAAAQAQETESLLLLRQAARNRWIQLDIVAGRLVFAGSQMSNYQSSYSHGSRGREQLKIGSDNGVPTMSYQRRSAEESLSYEIRDGESARVSRAPVGKSNVTPMEFAQVGNDKTTLTVGPAGHQQVYRAADLWRLCIAHPQACRENLLPWLDLLQPDWRLAQTVAKVEQQLLSGTGLSAAAEHARWMTLVAQLGDDRFARREAADRALRSGNPAVLGYLERLDFHKLDAEQQFRVRRIIAALSRQVDDDSPEQVATSLAGDPAVWLALLARPEAATRQIAARQLAGLLGEPIPVDPNADPATQQTQRQQLQMRVGGE